MSGQAKPTVLLRVLVAGGGSSVNDGLTAMLSEFEGLSVFGCVQEPRKVMTLVRTVNPDVVILDLHTAGPPGFKTLRQLKSQPHPPVVIVLTDYDAPAARRESIARGADHCLGKTECGRLQEVLADVLRRRDVRPPLSSSTDSGGK